MRPVANEVLQEIFTFACGEDDLNSQIPNALGIAAVCGKWRQLAIARPGLWSSFKIDLYGHSSKLEVHLEAYLTRSGQHLLTMHIIADHIDDEHPLLTKLVQKNPSVVST
ncbi:hypothetical protein BT96DRAFT_50362 [Gymnopus androsaceus JB14]|uniref:F-box domain-containing protein n=1 Tax=Gymnopus androsaceus JB14 TaxID=1447944 RepID=A0A6A4HK81_9AGAR|nr:hypothetical protein BT96DRAFT_50362 [Gymnopus androsaceus JB14]